MASQVESEQEEGEGGLQFQPVRFGLHEVLSSEEAWKLISSASAITSLPFKPKGKLLYWFNLNFFGLTQNLKSTSALDMS